MSQHSPLDDVFWNRQSFNKSIHALIKKHQITARPDYDFMAAFYTKLRNYHKRNINGNNYDDIIQRFILYSLITPGKSNLFKRYEPLHERAVKIEDFIINSFVMLLPRLMHPYKKPAEMLFLSDLPYTDYIDHQVTGRGPTEQDNIDCLIMADMIRAHIKDAKQKNHFDMLVCGYKPTEIQSLMGCSEKQIRLSRKQIQNTVRKILST